LYNTINKIDFSLARYDLTYLGICVIISIPFLYGVANLLHSNDGIPAGADAANHAFFIKNIIENNNPLIQYGQFNTSTTSGTGYYPSLLHIFVAYMYKITSPIFGSQQSLISTLTSCMFAAAIVGIFGYAIAIRKIMTNAVGAIKRTKKYGSDLLFPWTIIVANALAFGILMFSISPILKLYNDGTYSELFAMWLFFPFLLYSVISNRWIVSAVLLSIIAYTHNLSFVMSIALVLSYILGLAINRDFTALGGVKKFAILSVLLCIPAMMFFYVPTLTAVTDDKASSVIFKSWSKANVVNQITPLLYYGGAISLALLLFMNYRIFGWLSIWTVIYFTVFNFTYFIGARFARELSITYGISLGICIAYGIVLLGPKITRISGPWNSAESEKHKVIRQANKLLLTGTVLAVTIILSSYYYYYNDAFLDESNPLKAKYYSKSIDQANDFLATDPSNGTILVFGHNPWLKLSAYGKNNIFETVPPDMAEFLSTEDKSLNNGLHQLLFNPYSIKTKCLIKLHNIDFIFISDRLPERYYTEEQNSAYYSDLELFQRFKTAKFLDLYQQFTENDINIRIYKVDHNQVDNACV
jgi:hypothetical protein